ncbi:MAG: selenocysteine-specific translation elongation factor [Acidobacteriota bacterium]
MSYHILGTAGHIDHGKTALVHALTGVETDRLKEERERGITIDLGFAPLDLGGGATLGVVDVPGHERFIRNMLAGAGGIDIMLLVVAADESVKPQTREHFEICRLLGVTAGVVALTKIDLADPELVTLVRQEVEEMVAGSFLEGAEMVPVSAITGEGVGELRAALLRLVQQITPLPRPDFARLPVDRSFSVRGFGTVVTGTLWSGTIRLGDWLTLWPWEEAVKIRRLEVHGEAVERAVAGQRTAANLGRLGKRVPRRGDLLAAPHRMATSFLLDARLEALASLKGGIRDQLRVSFHLGTAEVQARIRVLGARAAIEPGETGPVQIRLAEPLAATPGDRFIIRRPTPALTLGGGCVIDAAPGKHRPGDRSVPSHLKRLASPDPVLRILEFVATAGTRGMGADDLVIRTGLSRATVRERVQSLARAGRIVQDGPQADWVMSIQAATRIEKRFEAVLAEFHTRRPLALGISLQELRRRGAPRTPASLVDALLGRLSVAGRLRVQGETAAAVSHRVSLDHGEEALLERVAESVRAGGLDPGDPVRLLVEGTPPGPRERSLLQLLRDRGTLVRIAEGYFLHTEVLQSLKEKLWEYRNTSPLIDVAAFKTLTGTSRRLAIPLLEYLDAVKITTRRGDRRYIQEPPERRG